MKNILLTFLLCVLPLSASQAETRWFVGGGGGLMTLEEPPYSPADPINGFLRGGLSLSEHFDIGIEKSISLIEDEVDSIDYSVDTTFIFVKANLPVSEDTKLYLMLGSSDVDLTLGFGDGFSLTGGDKGTGFGFGAQFDQSDNSAFSIDYIKYYDEADITIDSLNFGYTSYF
ncbi:MAG: porin family protein [Gammaproteobacteria bacterium]|nr:porin family protein [Gammaproteobacteria bacterium]